MPSRAYQLLRILGVGRAVIAGRFFPQGTSPVVNTTNKGKGYTITRTASAGIYTVTFDDKYVDLVHFGGTAQTTDGLSWTVSFGTYTVPTTTAPATMELFTRRGGVLLDLPADPNNSVAFWFTFRNSSVVF